MDVETIATNFATGFTGNNQAVFICIHKAGLEMAIEKRLFEYIQNELVGQYHFTRRNFTASPQNPKRPQQTRIPQTKRGFSALPGIRTPLQKLFSQDGWNS